MVINLPEFPKVKILECHSIPDLVGKEAVIVRYTDPDKVKYSIEVVLTAPITIKMQMQLPWGGGTAEVDQEMVGPFPFRPDELELVVETKLTELPAFFDDQLKDIELDPEKKPKAGEDDKPK